MSFLAPLAEAAVEKLGPTLIGRLGNFVKGKAEGAGASMLPDREPKQLTNESLTS